MLGIDCQNEKDLLPELNHNKLNYQIE